ncbi:transporter substrate-binding domain-containing protein [Oxalobacteraceae bacterium]|nr:transporter substrate-binding domain-containing protein [Oxalobacteraceae bacterium]
MISSTRGRRFFLLSTLFGAALFLAPPAARCAPQTVRLIMAEALDELGKPKPISPRHRKVLDYLEQALDVHFEVRRYPWIRAERNARAGEGLIFGLSKTPERLQDFHFSDAVASRNLWLVTRSDATFPFNSIQDLRGKSVGAVRGYDYGPEFEQAKDKLFRFGVGDVSSREARLTRLMLKRIDVVLIFGPASETAAEAEAGINAFMASRIKALELPPGLSFSVLPKPLILGDFQYFAIAAGKDDGIIARIDAALARGKKSGALEKSP